MAMEVHYPNKDTNQFNQKLVLLFDICKTRISLQDSTELIFMLIFTFECVVKIVAWGLLLHRNAYLWSMWNVLDFVVVTSGCEMLATRFRTRSYAAG